MECWYPGVVFLAGQVNGLLFLGGMMWELEREGRVLGWCDGLREFRVWNVVVLMWAYYLYFSKFLMCLVAFSQMKSVREREEIGGGGGDEE